MDMMNKSLIDGISLSITKLFIEIILFVYIELKILKKKCKGDEQLLFTSKAV